MAAMMKSLILLFFIALPFQAFSESYEDCTSSCNDLVQGCYESACGNEQGMALLQCQAFCDRERVKCFQKNCAGKTSLDNPKHWKLNREDPIFGKNGDGKNGDGFIFHLKNKSVPFL
jgi:hypothetical protein